MSFEDGAKQHGFDPITLEDAMHELYVGVKCTKLIVTIVLMNLYTIHGVSHKFSYELFALVHFHLLPELNCLACNYYVAKTLTQNLGLDYNNIHTYGKGCVLFQGDHMDAIHCPKCAGPHYKDEVNRVLCLKMLRHFSNYSQTSTHV
jgi:hypothetical protein